MLHQCHEPLGWALQVVVLGEADSDKDLDQVLVQNAVRALKVLCVRLLHELGADAADDVSDRGQLVVQINKVVVLAHLHNLLRDETRVAHVLILRAAHGNLAVLSVNCPKLAVEAEDRVG